MAAVVLVLRFFLLASFRYLSMMPFSIACTLFYASFGLLKLALVRPRFDAFLAASFGLLISRTAIK